MTGPIHFGSTIWDVVERAKRGDERAVDQLIRTYQKPIVQFIRRQGFTEADAEDLAQEVFLRISRQGVLQRVLQTGGKFRSLIIGVTKNIIHEVRRTTGAKKRGGNVRIMRMPSDSRITTRAEAEADDEAFDQFWMLHLVNRAFELLHKECVLNKTLYYEAVRLFTVGRLDYESVSKRIGVPMTNVKNLIRRGRLKLLDYIRQEIANYSQPGSQYEEEVKYLMKYLDTSPGKSMIDSDPK